MAAFDIVRERLRTQRVALPKFKRPEDVVTSLCAVQAQDYAGSLWGIAQRTSGATEADVEGAISERTIVRTWPMRGTLHFVAPDDVRWMLALLGPRVFPRTASRHRQLALDAGVFSKSRALLETALTGGRALTRPEIYELLGRARIATTGQRGIHILVQLALEGVLCFGARQGRQPTFVLLDEWIPTSRALERDEALGELCRRYFTGHGPATAHDFAWWSGLSLTDARRGVEIGGQALKEHVVDTTAYLSAPHRSSRSDPSAAHLLPAYDEYTVAYRDRSAFLEPANAARVGNGIFSPVVLVDGRIAGKWRREAKRAHVTVSVELFDRPTRAVESSLGVASERYGAFLGLPVSVKTRVVSRRSATRLS